VRLVVEEVRLSFVFRRVLAREGSEGEFRDHEASEERRHVLAQGALREVHEQDFLVVHEPAEIEARPLLADDRPEEAVGHELRHLVQHGSDRLVPEPVVLVFVHVEELADGRIGEVGGDRLPVRLVSEELRQGR